MRDYEYTSLTNSSLVDLDQGMLVLVDGMLSDTNQISEDMFYAINSMGESDGTELFRYSLSQLPDVAASSLTVSREVNRQIAGRSTEYRSMNGFASSKPGFNGSPRGAAGPAGKSNDMQGWFRAYGTLGQADSTGNFTDYDSSTVGTLVGVSVVGVSVGAWVGVLVVGVSVGVLVGVLVGTSVGGGVGDAGLGAGVAPAPPPQTQHASLAVKPPNS